MEFIHSNNNCRPKIAAPCKIKAGSDTNKILSKSSAGNTKTGVTFEIVKRPKSLPGFSINKLNFIKSHAVNFGLMTNAIPVIIQEYPACQLYL